MRNAAHGHDVRTVLVGSLHGVRGFGVSRWPAQVLDENAAQRTGATVVLCWLVPA